MQTRLIDEYLSGPRLLRHAVEGMSTEQLKQRPIAGRWSTLETVCHIVDSDALFAERMKRVIAEERPSFFGADPDLWATALAYHERDLSDELALLELQHKQMAHVLRSLPDAALTREGLHNTAGLLTLEQLLTKAVGHVVHHLPFIMEKRLALGL
jgi:uncharacterized damage-inducible protein DinB